MKKGFTLVEILVVATIIGLLAAIGMVSYTTINRQSRDARRRADLEQIRSAIEMYRSNNNTYPAISINCSSSGGLSDGSGNTYLSKIPLDPKCTNISYNYSPVSASNGACDGGATPCTNYTLGARFEGAAPGCGGMYDCGISNCTYCVGPYGQK